MLSQQLAPIIKELVKLEKIKQPNIDAINQHYISLFETLLKNTSLISLVEGYVIIYTNSSYFTEDDIHPETPYLHKATIFHSYEMAKQHSENLIDVKEIANIVELFTGVINTDQLTLF